MTAARTPKDPAPISRDGALTPLQRALQAHGMERALWTREVLERRHMDTAIGVVLAGQLELSWHQGDDETVVTALRPGDWFGEHNLLGVRAEAALSLRARTLARLLILPVDALQARLAHELAPLCAPLHAELAAALARRWLDLAAQLHQARHLGTDEQVLGVLHEAATWPSALSHPEGTLVAAPHRLLAGQRQSRAEPARGSRLRPPGRPAHSLAGPPGPRRAVLMRRVGMAILSGLLLLLATAQPTVSAAPLASLGFEPPLGAGALLSTWHQQTRAGEANTSAATSVKAPRIRRIGEPSPVSGATLAPISGAMRERRERYAAMIDRAAARHGIDAGLVHAVIRAESGYHPRARSSAGACGLMQLMPATARRFGVRDIWEPAENILGGVAYLRVLLDRFDGDIRLVLAAYNAGEGAVAKYGNRIPPYPETRTYVRRVLGYLGAA